MTVNIVEDSDKILFAEDLINYVFLKANVPYQQCTTEPSREFVYNGFNETARTAVDVLLRRTELQYGSFSSIHDFRISAIDITSQYFPHGFNANNVLPYCAHLAAMAAKFYTDGCLESPKIAIRCILNVLEHFDTTAGGWDTLENIAEQIIAESADD